LRFSPSGRANHENPKKRKPERGEEEKRRGGEEERRRGEERSPNEDMSYSQRGKVAIHEQPLPVSGFRLFEVS
jgi:hypothetical protein